MNGAGTTKRTLVSILKSLRPFGISKNLFIFAPIVFAHRLGDSAALLASITAFALFSLLASGVYIVNDIVDRESDRLHPVKRLRPIAAGHIHLPLAVAIALVLIASSIVLSYLVLPLFAYLALGYLVINLLYSVYLKRLVIIDVMTISVGFVIRVLVGAVVVRVAASDWIILCTFLLSLFLGFAKRRYELVLMQAEAPKVRTVLDHYSVLFLEQITAILAAVTIFCYIMYTMSPATAQMFGTHNLVYTVPMVVFGIFRYLYLIHKKEVGGNPTTEIFTDFPMVANLVVWAGAVYFLIYMR